MPDVGYIALVLAFVSSIYAAIASFVGARKKRADISLSARNAVIATCGLMSVAIGIVLAALIGHDFRLEYVASYTSRNLSLLYTLSAVWAGSKGSLLFWAWVLSLLITIMVLHKRSAGKELIPYAVFVAMIPQVFFLSLLLTMSNPFARLPVAPPDGNGLNPLLQNPGMFLHPPTLLLGYVGFTIPFAFAMAALITNKLGDEWVVASRRWILVAWMMLFIGNLAGSWWAYYVLGWGGYWAWDPVENAGLLPWLVGTALLHSIMMQRRRGIMKRWNMVLIILAFFLSLFGTFLTRSGVLASVHSFGDSQLGILFLGFIGIGLLASFGLLYYRSPALKSVTEIESVLSRESTFLLNNLLLVCGTFAVLVGTIFPIVTEAVRGVKITVGPPFFNQVMSPIFLAIIFLTGVCTMIGWRRASGKNLVRNFLFPGIAAVVVGVIVLAAGVRQIAAVIGVTLCVFVLFTIIYEWFRGTRVRHKMHGENYLRAFSHLVLANRPRYGGYIVHAGTVIMAIGIIASSLYTSSKEVTLKSGESVKLSNYSLTYTALDKVETPRKITYMTSLKLMEGNKPLGVLTPEKYYQQHDSQPVTVAAVRSTPVNDLYVILIGWDASGGASFKVVSNPLVNWIWVGGAILILGGLIAFWPEKQKQELSAKRTVVQDE